MGDGVFVYGEGFDEINAATAEMDLVVPSGTWALVSGELYRGIENGRERERGGGRRE